MIRHQGIRNGQTACCGCFFSFIFEKNGVEFELFHASIEGTFPITEEIDRSKFTGNYLTLYDGIIKKYGNKEVLK